MIPSAPGVGHRRGEPCPGDVGHRRLNDRDLDLREFADPVECGSIAAGGHGAPRVDEVTEPDRREDLGTKAADPVAQRVVRCHDADFVRCSVSLNKPDDLVVGGVRGRPGRVRYFDHRRGDRVRRRPFKHHRHGVRFVYLASLALRPPVQIFHQRGHRAVPRSFHQPSGRLPITFMPSTIHRTNTR